MSALSRRFVLVVGVVAVPVLAALLVVSLPFTWQILVLLLVIAITCTQFLVLRQVTGLSFPFVAIPVMAFNLVGAAGYLYYRSLEDLAQVGGALPAGSREFDTAAAIFAIVSLALTAGAILGSIRRPDAEAPDVKVSSNDLATALAHGPPAPLLFFAAIPLVLTILGEGPAELLNRASYLYNAGPVWMVTISGILNPIGIACAAIVLFGRGSRFPRFLAGFEILGYLIVLFAKDTRGLALVPLILLGLYIAQRGGRRLIPAAIIGFACAFVFLQLPLQLRGEVPGAGLQPYTSALIQNPGLVLGGSVGASIGNVLFAVPLTGYVATDAASVPPGELLTSLSPLPGSLTAWPAIEPLLRVGLFVPFNTLGELALNGMLVLVGFFVVLGFGATWMQRASSTLPGWRAMVMQLALGGSIATLTLSALEYNLRSSTRYAWYALGFYLLLRIVPVLKRAPAARTRGNRYRGPRIAVPERH